MPGDTENIFNTKQKYFDNAVKDISPRYALRNANIWANMLFLKCGYDHKVEQEVIKYVPIENDDFDIIEFIAKKM